MDGLTLPTPRQNPFQNPVSPPKPFQQTSTDRSDLYGYLQQHWVQGALGVPVNYSAQNIAVAEAFEGTGDFLRPNSLEAIGYLLDSGVKVALVYGDRDFGCNWIGGEKVSTAVDYSMSEKFKAAGYMPMLSTVGVGGQVRQYGNFSFSRVYQAGHGGE
jgi:carboxypeptidase C (cathepsin A)